MLSPLEIEMLATALAPKIARLLQAEERPLERADEGAIVPGSYEDRKRDALVRKACKRR